MSNKIDSVIISGIQQIGVGVADIHSALWWYRLNFGMDIPILDDVAVAEDMLPYTDGKPRNRHAIYLGSMYGGGFFELWQLLDETAKPPSFEIQLGDLGIFLIQMKTPHLKAAYAHLQSQGAGVLSAPVKDPRGEEHFFVQDPRGLLFEIVQTDHLYSKSRSCIGGVYGCLLGVSDIDRARSFYADILGYDELLYDETGVFPDFECLPGGREQVRRVLLTHKRDRVGALSRWLGRTQIELVQSLSRKPRKTLENRLWGDLGYLHLCMDIAGMDHLKTYCAEKGHPFVVDSADSFDMGDGAGRFSYIEDPDGTLIEFVETHRVTLVKKLGWYLDLTKRNPRKPLPGWMLRILSFSRIKD